MNRRISKVALFSAAAVSLGGLYGVQRALAAGVPQTNTLVYSGTLLNNGQPDTSSHFIILKLWLPNATSSACATIPSGNTQLTNGRFSVPFDPSCIPVIHQNQDVQVEVVIDGASMGKNALKAVPYALEADTASNPAPGSAIAALVPPGTINAYGGVVSSTVAPPPGWLLCNGSAVSRTQYAALFSAIGTSFGGGDGATTFNLPDLRGRFLRGVDQGAGNDPDRASRGAMAVGGNSGDAVGTVEGSQFGSHAHGVNDPGHTHGPSAGNVFVTWNFVTVNGDFGSIANPGGAAVDSSNIAASQTGISIQNSGGAETRPVNANVNYIIKI